MTPERRAQLERFVEGAISSRLIIVHPGIENTAKLLAAELAPVVRVEVRTNGLLPPLTMITGDDLVRPEPSVFDYVANDIRRALERARRGE